jgi:LmbE family N-acetylglucosaminyl deacetylase
MENILIISPHPEDAALGCGGAICKHVADGDNVIIVFLTSGEKGGAW